MNTLIHVPEDISLEELDAILLAEIDYADAASHYAETETHRRSRRMAFLSLRAGLHTIKRNV